MEIQTNQRAIEETSILSRSLVIANNEDNSRAAFLLKGIKGLKETVSNTFRPHIQNAHKAWKDLIAQEKTFIEPLDKAEQTIKIKMADFVTEQQRKQAIEQEKLLATAKTKEEAEKAKLEERADKWEAKGNEAKAEELRAVAQMTVVHVPMVEEKVDKQEGVNYPSVWKYRIKDENVIPREYLIVDESAIGKVVRALKGNTKIAGVEVYEEKQVRVSTK